MLQYYRTYLHHLHWVQRRCGPTGTHRLTLAKIEARRADARQQTPLAPDDPHILAVANDRREPDESLPQFDLDDIPAIADFIAAHCGLKQPGKVRDAIV